MSITQHQTYAYFKELPRKKQFVFQRYAYFIVTIARLVIEDIILLDLLSAQESLFEQFQTFC